MANEDQGPPSAGGDNWQRELVELARDALREQRRARRWSFVFKLTLPIYAVVLLVLVLAVTSALSTGLGGGAGVTGKHTGLVDLRGVIAPDQPASADSVVTGLRAAFKNNHTQGVILRINSPGGSPVQASYIYDEIRRLREEYPDKPLYAVVTDICASGGYYAAAAADEIYADETSIVGSIGVLMNGFGFTGLMDKLGVERRLLTAGENKAFLDPFSPLDKGDREHMQGLLNAVHEQFIADVKRGRGDRLSDDPKLFSGLIWTGMRSKQLGLVDAFGSAGYVAREVIGAERVVDYTPKQDLFDRLARGVGTAAGEVIDRALLERQAGVSLR